MHDIIKASIFAAIGVLVFASLLVPVVSDAMTTSGDSITYENPLNDGNYYMREIAEGDVLEIRQTEGQPTTVYVNDELVRTVENGQNGPYHQVFMSDALTVWTTSATGACQYAYKSNPVVNYTNATAIFTYTGDTIKVKVGTNPEGDLLVNPTWGYIVCNADQAEYYETIRNGQYPFYLKSDNDIVCSGVYTTGDNDTYYCYKDGVASVAEDYTVNYTINKTQVAGTTDIYTGNITLNIGGEEFTPFRIMIPIEVTGHQTSGALYDMLGILPIAVICVLIFGVLGAAVYQRIE